MAEVYVLNDRDNRYITSFGSKLAYHQNCAVISQGFDLAYHRFQAECARSSIIKIKEGRLEELLDA